MTKLFEVLFPGSPAVNSLLATAYISGPPNFLLALCPPNIDPSSLSVMVAFAVGGLLGDTLFHLLPEIFLGEDEPDRVRFVQVNNNKNLLLGVAIMVGFLAFVGMDKGLRIATGGDGHDHGHGHVEDKKSEGTTTAREVVVADKELRSRKVTTTEPETLSSTPDGASTSVKLSAWLNLIADFCHNITDGLALSSSFYASPALGASTTAAVFFHEVPHEVGDFALLIQGGFSKRQAMGAQFVTAVGAFVGTFLGIAIQELGNGEASSGAATGGLAGTGLTWGDLLLPFTAGTFMYVGTVGVFPELLETGKNRNAELVKTGKQLVAMLAGAGIMLAYVNRRLIVLIEVRLTTPQNFLEVELRQQGAPSTRYIDRQHFLPVDRHPLSSAFQGPLVNYITPLHSCLPFFPTHPLPICRLSLRHLQTVVTQHALRTLDSYHLLALPWRTSAVSRARGRLEPASRTQAQDFQTLPRMLQAQQEVWLDRQWPERDLGYVVCI